MPRHFKVEDLLENNDRIDLLAFASHPSVTIDKCREWLTARGIVIGRTAVGNWLAKTRHDALAQFRGEVEPSFIFQMMRFVIRQQHEILRRLDAQSKTLVVLAAHGGSRKKFDPLPEVEPLDGEYLMMLATLDNLLEKSDGRNRKNKAAQSGH